MSRCDLGGPSEFQNYGKRKLRETCNIYFKLIARRRDKIRAWREWGDRTGLPHVFGILKDYFTWHQDDVVEKCARDMGISTLELRNRGCVYVQNTVQPSLESNGAPGDHFNFLEQEVLLSVDERKAGVVLTDLDDIVQDIIDGERNRGNNADVLILQPLAVSQAGGNMASMNNLKTLVRQWLVETITIRLV